MIRNPYVVLKKVNNVSYLIPFGQGIIDRIHDARINETGEFIWQCLSVECSGEEIVSACMDFYGIDKSDGHNKEIVDSVRDDITEFLDSLTVKGLIIDKSSEAEENYAIKAEIAQNYNSNYDSFENTKTVTVKIADISLRITGDPVIFSDRLMAFEAEAPKDSDVMDVRVLPLSSIENGYKNGAETAVIRAQILSIDDIEDCYSIDFPQNSQLRKLLLNKNGGEALFYYEGKTSAQLQSEFFFALCHAFLYRALMEDCIMLHSASILYRGRAWLFSGHSGMGKSTHTKLWEQSEHIKMINGDLNLIRPENGKVMVYGSPWCGTSGMFDTKTYELGGIILLQQAKTDKVVEMSPEEQAVRVNRRLISPNWTESLFEKTLELTQKIVPEILVCRLQCTKNITAVAAIKERIDERINERG